MVRGIDDGETVPVGDKGCVRGNHVPSAHFCCDTKMALSN